MPTVTHAATNCQCQETITDSETPSRADSEAAAAGPGGAPNRPLSPRPGVARSEKNKARRGSIARGLQGSAAGLRLSQWTRDSDSGSESAGPGFKFKSFAKGRYPVARDGKVEKQISFMES